jgi:glyoxylase I family protein
MRGTIHHLDLTVRNPWDSRPFYDAVLGFLGYRLTKVDARGFDWDLYDEQGGFVASIGIMRAMGDGLSHHHNRYSPGLHHVAWHAESRADVERLFDLLRQISATVLDPPADYPQYGLGCYAVLFRRSGRTKV